MNVYQITDTAWLIATVVLFSTGHWIGAIACLLLSLSDVYNRRQLPKTLLINETGSVENYTPTNNIKTEQKDSNEP